MRNYLIFGGVSSADYGIYITGSGVYNAPERSVERVTVPGRNGLIVIDQGRYENVSIEYPAFAFGKSRKEFREKIGAFRNAILSKVGYQRLEDTYHLEEYRMALYAEGLNVDVGPYGGSGRFTLRFDCKPQRFLVSGESAIETTNGEAVNNPTPFDASPLLEVEGYGTIAFNGFEIELDSGEIGAVTIFAGGIRNREIEVPQQFNTGDSFHIEAGSYAILSRTFPSIDISSVVVTGYEQGSVGTATYDSTSKEIRIEYPQLDFIYGTAQLYYCIFTIEVTFRYSSAGPYQTSSGRISSSVRYAPSENKIEGNADPTSFVGAGAQYFMTTKTIYDAPILGVSTMTPIGHPTYIDCDLGEAYKEENGNIISLNRYIDLGSNLPTLASGRNEIAFDNTIANLKIIPRWWQI